MAIELLVGKMIAPLYGSSFLVWASVIGISLIALAIGYFIGGRLTQQHNTSSILLWLLFSLAVIIGLLSPMGQRVIYSMSGYSLWFAALLSSAFLLFPPLIVLGIIPPFLISMLCKEKDSAGKTAGLIYSISTFSGIVSTLVVGFYIIPELGIKKPLLAISYILFMISFYGFLKNRKFIPLAIGLLVLFVITQSVIKKPPRMKQIKIKEQLEGLYGQINIIDNLAKQERILVINNITQTLVNLDDVTVSQMNYVHNLSIFSSLKKTQNAKALLCGMGGGSILNELLRQGFETDAVEIDSRMAKLSNRYFNMSSEGYDLFVDDARHYIRNSNKKYDLVVMDLLSSEVQPAHLFSLEHFNDLKKNLNKNAIIIINFQGYLYGKEGLSTRSILKTMVKAGYNTSVYFDPDEINTIVTDIFLIASPDLIDFEKLDFNQVNECCRKALFNINNIKKGESVDLESAFIITDDNSSILDQLDRQAINDWRMDFVKEFRVWEESNMNVPLFQ